jgi:DNA-binding winged helix-turn-helix (wHTH) protein
MTTLIYETVPFRVEVERRRVWKDGEPIALPPKCFELLVELLEAEGGLRTQACLLETVWRGVKVNEAAVGVHVAKLRKCLDDDAEHPRYVGTVFGKGYLWLLPVRVIRPGNAVADGLVSSHPRVQLLANALRLIDRVRSMTREFDRLLGDEGADIGPLPCFLAGQALDLAPCAYRLEGLADANRGLLTWSMLQAFEAASSSILSLAIYWSFVVRHQADCGRSPSNWAELSELLRQHYRRLDSAYRELVRLAEEL